MTGLPLVAGVEFVEAVGNGPGDATGFAASRDAGGGAGVGAVGAGAGVVGVGGSVWARAGNGLLSTTAQTTRATQMRKGEKRFMR